MPNDKDLLAKKVDLASKQDTLIAGTNITIGQDGKTISATGGGSSVSVTPILTTGTRIGSITVDSTVSNLYAPNPTAVSVSQVVSSGTEIARVSVNGTSTSIYTPSSVVAALSDLTDVQLSSLSDRDTLIYDATSSKWINSAGGGGGGGTSITKLWDAGFTPSPGVWLEYDFGEDLETYDALVIDFVVAGWEGNYNDAITIYPKIQHLNTNACYHYVKGTDYGMHVWHISGTIYALGAISGYYPPQYKAVYGIKYGSGGGGGSSVIPNPQDPATDTLTKVGINGTIYDIAGGGGSGYTETTLWSGSETPSTAGTDINLSGNISDYDMIAIHVGNSSYTGDNIFLVSSLTIGDTYISTAYYGENLGAYFTYTSDTQINIKPQASNYPQTYTKVVGINFGSGGGSNIHNYSTNEQVIGTWIDGNTIYEKTYTIPNLTTSYTVVDLGLLSSSIDLIWIHEGFGLNGVYSTGNVIPYSDPNAAGEMGMIGYVTKDNSTVEYHYRAGSDIANGTAYITFRYTKTTS